MDRVNGAQTDTARFISTYPGEARSSAIQRRQRRRARRGGDLSSDDEPLIDKTTALSLRSKKTLRTQKKLQRKEAKKVHSDIKSFLDLPHELLSLVFSFLEPSDIFSLQLVSQLTNDIILDYESAIAASIISRRYWVLAQCFRLPIPLSSVPQNAHPALLSPDWQSKLRLHKNPSYQHFAQIDPNELCTCMHCVLAWNNLNIILDLAHFQSHLDAREPLPIIPRGRHPEWNTELLAAHAVTVTKAIYSPLTYARILQLHLQTTTRTILRSSRWRKKGEKADVIKPRLYRMSDADVDVGTDQYLERSGPPSYQAPYMRDNYYTVEAFVPNRKWDKEEGKWLYYPKGGKGPHEADLAWVVARFTPKDVVGTP